MKRLLEFILLTATALSPVRANEFADQLTTHAKEAASWVQNPVILKAIERQNQEHADLSQEKIIALDKQWRSEVGASSQPLISKVMSNALSEYLISVQESSAGLYTEIFVMDNKGLNVGQSEITSDYWQGDESKWQKSYGAGPGSIHVGEVEQDESTQMFQSQLSISISNTSGQVIGAVTIGINLEEL